MGIKTQGEVITERERDDFYDQLADGMLRLVVLIVVWALGMAFGVFVTLAHGVCR